MSPSAEQDGSEGVIPPTLLTEKQTDEALYVTLNSNCEEFQETNYSTTPSTSTSMDDPSSVTSISRNSVLSFNVNNQAVQQGDKLVAPSSAFNVGDTPGNSLTAQLLTEPQPVISNEDEISSEEPSNTRQRPNVAPLDLKSRPTASIDNIHESILEADICADSDQVATKGREISPSQYTNFGRSALNSKQGNMNCSFFKSSLPKKYSNTGSNFSSCGPLRKSSIDAQSFPFSAASLAAGLPFNVPQSAQPRPNVTANQPNGPPLANPVYIKNTFLWTATSNVNNFAHEASDSGRHRTESCDAVLEGHCRTMSSVVPPETVFENGDVNEMDEDDGSININHDSNAQFLYSKNKVTPFQPFQIYHPNDMNPIPHMVDSYGRCLENVCTEYKNSFNVPNVSHNSNSVFAEGLQRPKDTLSGFPSPQLSQPNPRRLYLSKGIHNSLSSNVDCYPRYQEHSMSSRRHFAGQGVAERYRIQNQEFRENSKCDLHPTTTSGDNDYTVRQLHQPGDSVNCIDCGGQSRYINGDSTDPSIRLNLGQYRNCRDSQMNHNLMNRGRNSFRDTPFPDDDIDSETNFSFNSQLSGAQVVQSSHVNLLDHVTGIDARRDFFKPLSNEPSPVSPSSFTDHSIGGTRHQPQIISSSISPFEMNWAVNERNPYTESQNSIQQGSPPNSEWNEILYHRNGPPFQANLPLNNQSVHQTPTNGKLSNIGYPSMMLPSPPLKIASAGYNNGYSYTNTDSMNNKQQQKGTSGPSQQLLNDSNRGLSSRLEYKKQDKKLSNTNEEFDQIRRSMPRSHSLVNGVTDFDRVSVTERTTAPASSYPEENEYTDNMSNDLLSESQMAAFSNAQKSQTFQLSGISSSTPLEANPADNTTIMLRNIPNKYTQKMLLEVVNANYRGLYDFFYLPIDFRNRCNVGYAFINFIHTHYAQMFMDQFHGFKLSAFKSHKVCEVSWGRVQGLQGNIEHYRNSAVMSIPYTQYKPMLFKNGLAVPFPTADGPLPSVKLRPQKR